MNVPETYYLKPAQGAGAASSLAAALRTVTSWRTGDLPTYERIHYILRQLPATLQGLPRPLLAHVIVGDGARLYVLAEVLRALPAG